MIDKDDGPDGMLAYQLAIRSPSRDDPSWPLPSFDARDWAEAFCKIAADLGHPGIDEGWMVSWFANALMRGYDEHAARVGQLNLDVRCQRGCTLQKVNSALRQNLPNGAGAEVARGAGEGT